MFTLHVVAVCHMVGLCDPQTPVSSDTLHAQPVNGIAFAFILLLFSQQQLLNAKRHPMSSYLRKLEGIIKIEEAETYVSVREKNIV